MGCSCKVKELTRKKQHLQKLATKIADYVYSLKVGFNQGKSNAKILSTPLAQRELTEALGQYTYDYVIRTAEDISQLMYGNTPEWKRKVSEYVNGWLFIQMQILNGLRFALDITTQMTSLSIICEGIMQPNERIAAEQEMGQLCARLVQNFTDARGPDGKDLYTHAGYATIESFLGPDGRKVSLKGNVNLTSTDAHSGEQSSTLYHWVYKGPGSPSYEKALSEGTIPTHTWNNVSGTPPGTSYTWCDVSSPQAATRTVCVLNSDIAREYNQAIKNGFLPKNFTWSYIDGTDEFGNLISNGKTLTKYSIARCLVDLISTQEGYINYNEQALELSIEQGKMAYEKAGEMEREIEEIIEGAECILTDRADLYSLLAVSAATSLIC